MAKQTKKSTKPNLARLNTRKNRLLLAAILAGAALIALVAYNYYSAEQEIATLKSKQASSETDTQSVIRKVGALTNLPAEEPTVATVTDIQKLRTQAFFANAQNGDRVLIFTKTKKAIIYRPSTNKIIEIAPIIPGEGQGTTTPAAASSPAP